MNIRQTVIVTSILISSLATAPTIFAITPTTMTMLATEEATTPASVEYTLPYPGILPDHPLYFLKNLRDQIMQRLIADPVRKIEFYMLQADKHINMGVFLAAKNNESLSSEVLFKGQKYMGQAVGMASELKSQGKEVPSHLVERFTNAGLKYVEILTELKATELVESVRKVSEDVAKLK